jgi:hypothetical protein
MMKFTASSTFDDLLLKFLMGVEGMDDVPHDIDDGKIT